MIFVIVLTDLVVWLIFAYFIQTTKISGHFIMDTVRDSENVTEARYTQWPDETNKMK